ncbi:epimerase [Burkholderia cepacia]|uniref:NAD(P)H-binding protein n=1 Tax=Burkholderia cepacia TaxID=292 RepID=UPI00075973C6|nr:NAD(P)H-binding protein [Burkholderia cepacia]KWB20489.1 epimerase [Burkholderia cepacia]
MKIILFGASGMVGQGVLRECLLAADVETVLVIVRKPIDVQHAKLRQLVCTDLFDYSGVKAQLSGYDACLFCLGSSSSGASEADFARINHDLPLAAAHALADTNRAMVFVYVSGAGTDSTEHGRVMWANVKGRTENALQTLGFKAVYLFRPGFIVPANGEVSKTKIYRWIYGSLGWALALLAKALPTQILDTEQIGLAMLHVASGSQTQPVVDSAAIHRLAVARRTGA